MKAVVLAGGRGKRLDEASAPKNKCMFHVSGKPAIQYSFDCLDATDIDEIIVVVGYRAEEIINHFGNKYGSKTLKYVVQWEQRGLVHAIDCAREALEGDDFLLMLGDEITVNPRHQAMLDEFREGGAFALCGVVTVDDKERIKRTYTVIQDDNGTIYRLIEKPRKPLNNIMGTGNCVFKNAILDYIEVTPTHYERKEKELPDLIQSAIDDGNIVKLFHICSAYTNINAPSDIELAMKLLAGGKI